MMAAIGITSLAVGTVIAFLAERYPRHQQSMQTWGGVLLIGGLAVLGHLLDAPLVHIIQSGQSLTSCLPR